MTALGWWWRGDAQSSAKLQSALLDHQESLPAVKEDIFASHRPEAFIGDGRWWLLTLPEEATRARQIQMRKTSLAMAWLNLASHDLRAWAIEQFKSAPDTHSNTGIRAALLLVDQALAGPIDQASLSSLNSHQKSWALGWLSAIGLHDDAAALMDEGVEFDEKSGGGFAAWLIAHSQHQLLEKFSSRPGFSSSGVKTLSSSIQSDAASCLVSWRKHLIKYSGAPSHATSKEELKRTGKVDWSDFKVNYLAQMALLAGEDECLGVLLRQGARFAPDGNPYSIVLKNHDAVGLRVLLSAGVSLDEKEANALTQFMAMMDEAKFKNPTGGWARECDQALPLYDKAMRVHMRNISKPSEWANLIRTGILHKGRATLETLIKHNPTQGSWDTWFNIIEKDLGGGQIDKKHTSFMIQAIENTAPEEQDSVMSSLVCPKIDVMHQVDILLKDKSFLPIGFLVAGLAPGSLKKWLDHSSSASLSKLALAVAPSGIKRGEIPMIGTDENIWCAAIRSDAPHLALGALASKPELAKVIGKGIDVLPHYLAIDLAATQKRWDSLEAALEFLPAPIWSEATFRDDMFKIFQRPFDEHAMEKMIVSWPIDKILSKQGKSALREAVDRDDQALALLLIKHGSDPDQADKTGATPREIAQKFDNASEWDKAFAEAEAAHLGKATQISSAPAQPRNRL